MRRTRILFGRSALVIAGAVGTLTLTGPPTTRADSWSPGVTVGSRFDHQTNAAPGTGGDWIHSVTPQLLLERLGPFTTWDLRAERRYDTAPHESGLHRSHDVVIGALNSQWAEHSRASLEGSYFDSRDAFNPDPQAAFSASDQSRASGSIGVETWRAQGGYSIENATYQAPGLDDGRSQSWDAALFLLRTETNRWLVRWRREEWTVASRQELAASAATFGMRRQHSSTMSSRLELGVARIADDRVGPPREDLAVVAGLDGFGRLLRLPFDARAEVRRDVTTSGLAEIWRSIPGIRVSLRWERSLHATGGYFDEPTDQDFVAFQAQDTLGGRSIVSLEGSYRREHPRSLADARLETYRAAAAVSRDLQPWLRGRVRYSMAQQSASAGIGAFPFDRSRVEFMLTAVYQ